MSDWKEYEEYIFQQCRIYFPTASINLNDSIRGRLSRANRQIDISIRATIENFSILGIIECKYFNKKVNVKHIDSLVGFTEDVGAQFGYLITNKGFSKSAFNRAANAQLRLKIVPFQNLSEVRLDMDDIINAHIQSIECTEAVFLLRQYQNTHFTDVNNTSLERRILTLKEGFADLEYFVHKKLLLETARVYRDFSCVEKIKVVIPSKRERYIYTAETNREDVEEFLKFTFEYLRADIQKWREFIQDITRAQIDNFSKQFICAQAYLSVDRDIQ